ncbi:MAG: GtrA family protein [Christensenellales bacterium]|jgi:putative flippase GtrA
MIQWIRDRYTRHRELVLYLIFGALTTLVNIASFFLLNLTGLHYMASTVIAWMVSVLFAYVTNRKYVFGSGVRGFGPVLLEMAKFFAMRGVSGGFDVLAMFVMVDLLSVQENIAKLLSNVIVIILNYVFSKLFIFRKSEGTK